MRRQEIGQSEPPGSDSSASAAPLNRRCIAHHCGLRDAAAASSESRPTLLNVSARRDQCAEGVGDFTTHGRVEMGVWRSR